MNYPNGDSYIGMFKYNDFDGKGVFRSEDKSFYSGEFKNGFKHGNGKYCVPNAYRITGNFKRGKLKGLFEIKFDKGNKYTGVFKDKKVKSFDIVNQRVEKTKKFWKNNDSKKINEGVEENKIVENTPEINEIIETSELENQDYNESTGKDKVNFQKL